jgi:PKD repeat protein
LSYNIQTSNINVSPGNSQASTFSWVAADNANVSGESTTAVASGTINDMLNNVTNVNQTVIYTVTPTGTNLCAGNSFTVTVIVKPEPVITVGQNQAACSGNALNYKILMDNFNNPADNVTFTWPTPVLFPFDPGFTGGSARLSSSAANIIDTFTNTTGLIGTATYTVTPVYNGCTGNPVTVVITVGSEPVLDPGLNRFSCSGEVTGLTLKEATGSVTATYYSIVLQSVDAGLTPNYGGNTLPNTTAPANYLATHVFTNTTTSNKTVTYRITPILAPDCIGDPVDVVVTVRPPILAGTITGNTSICYNTDAPNIPNAVVASGGDGVINYAWYYTENLAAVPGDANWTLIPGETGSSYNPGVLVNPTKYIRKASDGSCVAVAYTNMIQIDINPLPVTGIISGDATICESATNKVYQVPNTPGSTYFWTVPASLNRTSPQGLYFIIVDATGPSAPGDKITVVETFTSTTGCVGLPVEKFVTVVGTIPGEVVAGPATVCQGDANIAYSVTDNPGSTYSWVVPAGATITSDPSKHEIFVTFTMAGSGDVSVVETNGAVCTTVHVAKHVTINPLPTVYNLTAPSAYCSGGTGVTVTLSNSQTGVNYQLYKDAATDGAPLAGSTGSAITWTSKTTGSYYVVATNATTTCTQQMNGTVVVTINNVDGGTIGTDHAICDGSGANPLTNTSSGTGGGTITYQWQSSTDNFATAPVNIVGATSATYTPGTLTQDTWFRRVAYSTMGTSVCSANSNVVLITVINFVPGSIDADQNICEGTAPVAFASVSPTGDGVFTYQWKNSTDGITYSDIVGANLETYTSPALTVDTWFKRAVTSTLLGVQCTKETNAIRVTVINFNPGSIATDQTICEAAAPATFTSVAPTGDGTKTYKWQISTDGVSFSDISGANNATYTSGVLSVDTWFRRGVISTLGSTSCTLYTTPVKVTINIFDPGSVSAAQTICEGDTPVAFTSVDPSGIVGTAYSYQWQSSIDNVTYSNIPGATLVTYASGALNQDTWFRRRVTATLNGNACTEFTVPVLITVNNFIPGTISGTQTVCETEIPTAFTETSPTGDGTFTYQWEESTDNTTWTTVAGALAATYAPPAALSQDTWFRRQVTSTLSGKTCTEATNTIKVTVNNFVPGSIGTDQTICENTSAAPLSSVTPTGDGVFTYRWLISSDGTSFSLIGGAISETYSPGILAADRWYKREVTSTLNGKSCIKETNVVKVTVNNMVPGSITADQTICDGGSPVAFGSVIASGDGIITYQWMESNNGIAFVDITGATSDTYTAPALTEDTWYRRSATSTLGGNTCTEESNILRVTVINFTPGSIGTDQTICSGSAPASFTSAAPGGDGIFSFQWQSSPDGSSWSDIGGATSATYTSPAVMADTYFRRRVISTLNAVSCTQYTNPVLVTVINFVPGSIGTDQTICEGDAPVAFTSVAPTGDGVFTYQWQFSTDGSSFTNIAGATGDVFAPGILTVDTWYRRQVISTLNSTQCNQYTAAVKITVNNFTAGSISAAQTICEGDNPAAFTSVTPTGDGTFTYKWQNSTDGSTFSDIAGETGETFDAPVLTQDTWYKRLVISTLGLNTCTKETNIVKISVNNFVPGSIGSDQTICENSIPVPLSSVIPTGDGSFTYRWFSSPDGTSWSVIGGAISETYTPGIVSADTWYKREVTSTLLGKACVEETNSIKITVNNMLPGSISADQTICDGAAPAAFTSVDATGDGAISYQWYESINGIAFNPIAGATSATYTSPVLIQDTWFRRDATSTLGLQTCTEESNIVKVTVINFLPGSIGSDQTICEGTAPAAFTSLAASGDGTKAYQWQSSPDGSTWSDIGGATSATYTSPAIIADTYFRRRVTATLNAISCIQYTNTVIITVNNFDPGSIATAQTICEGDTPVAFTSVAAAGDGVITYQWQISTDGSSYISLPGETNETFSPGSLIVDTWFRRQATSTLNSMQCVEYSPAIMITVNNFTPGSIGANQTICEGDDPVTFTAVAPAGDGTFTFQWQNSSDGITFTDIPGETSAVYDAPVLTQDTWYKRLVTSDLGGKLCTLETNTIRVTVNNFDPQTIGSDQVICKNIVPAGLTSVTPTGDGTFTFKWYSSTDGLTFTVIPGAISETYNPPALTADMWYYREVKSTLNGKACTETTNTVRITVNNMQPGSISSDQTICDGSVPVAFTSVAATGDGIITYQWKESADGIAFTDLVGETGATYAAPSLTADKWYKRAAISTLGGNVCTEESNVIRVTVINFTQGSIGTDQTICEATVPAAFTSVAASGDGAKGYQWQSSPDGSSWSDIGGATSATYTSPALTSDTYFRRRVNSTLNAVTCTLYTNTVLVTVNNFDPGSISAAQTICEGDTPAAFTSVTPTGDGAITYQWQSSTDGVSFVSITGETNETYASGPLTEDTWFRRQVTSTLSGNACIEYTSSIKVTVNNFIPGSISSAQTICEGDDPAAFTAVAPSGDGTFTFQWQNSTDGITFTDILTATGATYDAPALTQDTWYKRLVTSDLGGKLCTEETNTVKITVNNFDPGSIATDQTICEGTAPAPLTSVAPSGDGFFTYKWLSSTDGLSFSVIAGAVNEAYSPSMLTVDTWYKRETTSTLSGKSCAEETNVVKITVNNFVPGSISSNQTICEGAVPAGFTSVTPTGDAGAVFSYQWKSSLDGIVFSDIAGAIMETYTPVALSVDTWFKRSVTSTLGTNTCTEETNTVRVTVINFSPGSVSADQTICEATAPAAFTGVSPGGDGVFAYQWQNSTDGASFSDIPGANGATYTAPALSTDTWYRRTVISTLNGTSCSQNTNSVKVTINHVDPGTVGSDQTICEGTAPVIFTGTVPTGDGVLTYQWQSSIDGVSFTNITGATVSTYTSGILVQDTWFKRMVTSTLNGNSCGETSPAVKVTVNNFTQGSISAAQTICDGGTPAAFTSVTPLGDGTFTYQWQSSTDNVTFTNIGGATSETYTSGPLTADTWFKRLVTSTMGTNTCTKETNTILITVNNFLPGSIGSDQTICENTAPATITSVTPTGDGSFTYRWFSSADGSSFSVIPGAINESYVPGTLMADTWYKREVTSTLNGKSCVVETNVIRITVNNFVPGSIGSNVTLCEGGIPPMFTSVTPTGDGTFSYQWKNSTDGVNYLDIPGAVFETYSAGALTQDTWYKRVVISTLNGIPCTKETAAIKVTINNVNAGTIISDQTICIGSDPVTFWSVVPGTGDGVVTYQWQSSSDGAIFSDVATATGATYDPPAITADTWYRRITKSLLNTVECTKVSNIVKITVNVVTGGTITANQTICFGSSPVAFGSSDDGSGTGAVTYQWLRSDNNVIYSTIPGANTTTYTAGVHYTDTYYKRQIISIQNGILCTAESNVIKVTINPLPIAVLSGGATICPSQSAVLKVEMLAGTGPYELDIQNLGVVTGYTSNADINVSPVVTTTYKLLRVKDANGCEILNPSANLIGTATVTVRTLPAIVTSPGNKVVCEFGVTTFNVAATGSDLTFQWYVNDGAGFDPVADGGIYYGASTATLNLFGATRDMNNYVYHAVATGCSTSVTSTDAILTVNTPAEINVQPKDSTICMSGNASFSVTAMGTSINYKWQVNKGTGFADVVNDINFGGAATNNLTITNAPGTFNNYIFRAVVSGICGTPVYSNFVVLRVYTPPVVTLNPANKTVCDGGGPVTFIGNGSGQIDSLRWQVYSAGVWSEIYDNAVYSGTASQQLTLSNIPLAYNNYQFRLGLKARCTTVYTNAATLTVNANPVVTFTSPVNACGDVPLTLNPVLSGGSGVWAQHLWTGDVGPLNNYFIQSPSFKSQIAGTYVLNYKVKDNKGCYGNSDITVVVDAPDAEFTQTAMNGCTPLAVTFNKDMTGYTNFTWDFGDGSPVNTTDANPVHTFTNTNPASIEYRNVKLTVRSAGGCTDVFTSTVTVYPSVSAVFTENKNIVCSGSSVIFTTTPGAGKYFWDFGDGSTGYSPSETATHLYTNLTNAPMVLTVSLTTTSFYNCTDTKTLTVTVMPKPVPQFTALPVSQIYNAAGNQVTFTNTTNAGTWTYLWKFGDGATSSAENPVHNYTALGTFDVVLTVNNSNCIDSIKHSVSVTPPPPVANFDEIESGCVPLAISLNNTSLNTNIPGTTFRWDFGDGSISTSKNPSYSYFDAGTYKIELTVTGPGGKSTFSRIVNVYQSPKAYFNVSPTLVFVNDKEVRAFNLSQDADKYIWEWGDGDTSKIKEPYHKYMEEGVYDITLWAYSDNGCSDKYVLSPGVTVEPAGTINFSTAFTPNLDGPIDMDHLPTGGNEIDQFFFPPIREKVTDYKLQIFNRLGVLIFESHDINHPWNGYYKDSLCPQGVYIWYVEGKYANGEPFKKVGDVTLLH